MVMVQSAAPPDRQHVIRVRGAASGLALEGPSSGVRSMSLHGPPSEVVCKVAVTEVLCKVAGTGLLSNMSMFASGLLCKGAVRLLSIPLQGTASGLLCKGAVVGKIHREIHGMAMEGAVLSMQALPNASGLVQPRDPRHCWKNCCQGNTRYTAPPESFASIRPHLNHCWNDRCQGSPRLRAQAFRRPQSATFHSMAHNPQAYLRSQVPFRMQGTGPTSF